MRAPGAVSFAACFIEREVSVKSDVRPGRAPCFQISCGHFFVARALFSPRTQRGEGRIARSLDIHGSEESRDEHR